MAFTAVSCTGLGEPETDTPTVTPASSSRPKEVRTTRSGGVIATVVGTARADARWNRRAERDATEEAIALWTEAAEANPDDARIATKLAHAHVYLVDAFVDHPAEAIELLDTGVRWGETALLSASPEFAAQMDDGVPLSEAVRVVDAPGIPALYWYARALSEWSKRRGFAVFIGQKENVLSALRQCVDLEPSFQYGGPLRHFAAYFAQAPAFAGGDVVKAKKLFERALDVEPDFAETKLQWARTLSVKNQNRAQFDRLLAEIAATPDDVLVDAVPETRAAKRRATALAAEADELF